MVTKNFIPYLIQKYGNKYGNVTILLINLIIIQAYHIAFVKEPSSKSYYNTKYSKILI